MLAALTVRDIVLIESAALEFAPGLNVLTGETGAGKSICSMPWGWRPGAVAAGARVSAPARRKARLPRFSNPPRTIPPSHCWPSRRFPPRRDRVAPDAGAGRPHPGPSSMTSRSASACCAMSARRCWRSHGQADDRGLFDVATHRGLLDTFAGHDALLRETAVAFDRLRRRGQGPGGPQGAGPPPRPPMPNTSNMPPRN
ncbi:MAG: hypothetical protein WDN08_18705 [Rhizomicrobium sp.]